MTMPEAAINEDDLPPRMENKVRLARKILPVQSVAKAGFVKKPPDDHFRLGVPPAYAGHVQTALLGSQNIRHGCYTASVALTWSMNIATVRSSRRRSLG
jgi:hypothetical protein